MAQSTANVAQLTGVGRGCGRQARVAIRAQALEAGQTARGSFFDDLLHTGVIVLTISTS